MVSPTANSLTRSAMVGRNSRAWGRLRSKKPRFAFCSPLRYNSAMGGGPDVLGRFQGNQLAVWGMSGSWGLRGQQ